VGRAGCVAWDSYKGRVGWVGVWGWVIGWGG
jgi:hypothetical protein